MSIAYERKFRASNKIGIVGSYTLILNDSEITHMANIKRSSLFFKNNVWLLCVKLIFIQLFPLIV